MIRRRCVALIAAVLLAGSLLSVTPAAAEPGDQPDRDPADLELLYVGAHPDDEAGRLSMFGEWRERFGVRTGVVTVTRGEGGGNAVGPEEGPALGLIREREERSAVAYANLTDVYNFDQVDSYYSVSEPLYRQIWGHEDTLGRLIRVIRQTRPEILATMNPTPSPGNHGAHQEAALLAIEAYYLAGDPAAYADQVRLEGLQPWAPRKLFTSGARGAATAGETCATTFKPAAPAEDIYGVWSGRTSTEFGQTWAQIEREGMREYRSQGWAGFPDVPADPAELGCDFMTQVDARVPFTRGNLSEAAAASETMLTGAVMPADGGLPLGTGLEVSASEFSVVPGGSTTITIAVTAPKDQRLSDVTVDLGLPDGWTGSAEARLGSIDLGQTRTAEVEIKAPADATTNQRALVDAEVQSGRLTGYGNQQLEVVPVVSGASELLPQVATFADWAGEIDVPQLRGTVKPVLTLPSGGARDVRVDVVNNGEAAQSGTVSLNLPAGFEADEASKPYAELAPGATTDVTFTVTNTDAALPTSNAGGDYDYTITTTSAAGEARADAGLELTPTATVEESVAPQLDGVIGEGEYGTAIDLSRVWEGQSCASAADCSATGQLSRHGDDLYVAAAVTDDTIGTLLTEADCKRHWRTDSVEIAIDPDGNSENTSTTFKMFVLPATAEGPACAGRDADNRQGPITETAPGVAFAAALNPAGDGYVVEVKIPASELPATVDPTRLGVNVFAYDSDTQDKTGQTRIGWSTWGGVQGDPYRWGRVQLPGWTPPNVETKEPVIPDVALASQDSPQSIAQAVRTGVALAGGPAADDRRSATVLAAERDGADVVAQLRVNGPGQATVFALDEAGEVVGSIRADLSRGDRTVRIPVDAEAVRVLMAYAADSGGTTASATPVRS